MATNVRIGIAQNLPTGATYDLLLLTHPDGYPEGKLSFKLYDVPRKITGIQKVAQTFLKTLFSRTGSDVLHPTYGTGFPDIVLRANRQSNDPTLTSELTTCIRDGEIQTKYILNSFTSDPATRLRNATIIGLDTGAESITMYIRIITDAGELAQVAVPFPELDLSLSQG